MRPLLLLLPLTLLSGACSSSTNQLQPPSDRSAYPAGPYGEEEGDVIASLSFVGPDGNPAELAAVFADEDNRVLLLNTAAGWCGACVEEQPVLQQLQDERAGLAVLVALFEDADGAPADAALARSWQERHAVSFSVVADPEFLTSAYYDPALTPMNMVVDVDSMEIVRVGTGFDEDAVVAAVDALRAQKGLP